MNSYKPNDSLDPGTGTEEARPIVGEPLLEEYVGNRIRERRKALRMSQSNLADLLGISYQQVQRYETGKNTLTLKRLIQIALAMNVKPDHFYEGAPMHEMLGAKIDSNVIVKQRLRPLRVLLVEDSTADEILFCRSLIATQSFAEVHCIRESDKVMDYLHNHSTKYGHPCPDIIVLDLNLPKINGLALLKMIKQNQATRNIPVLILTNSVRVEDMEEGYKYNANGFHQKSGDYNEFCQEMGAMIHYWAKTVILPTENKTR